jgi:hypothetical protein
MLKTLEGTFREGHVQLDEPARVPEGTRVLVTLLERAAINLAAAGIDSELASEARWRLGSMAEDWDRPEMAVYDDL